jgi:hypothetical protein
LVEAAERDGHNSPASLAGRIFGSPIRLQVGLELLARLDRLGYGPQAAAVPSPTPAVDAGEVGKHYACILRDVEALESGFGDPWAVRNRIHHAPFDSYSRSLLLDRVERVLREADSPTVDAPEPGREETLRERVERLGALLASPEALTWKAKEYSRQVFLWRNWRKELAHLEEAARLAKEQAEREEQARLSLEEDAARWRALVGAYGLTCRVSPSFSLELRVPPGDVVVCGGNPEQVRETLTRFVDGLRAPSPAVSPTPAPERLCPVTGLPCAVEKCCDHD